MRLPPASDSSVKDMIMGVELTVFGLVFASRSYVPGYSGSIGDLIVFVGIWITLSGYYSDKSRVDE